MLFFAVRKKSIMDSFDKYISRNLPLVSLISAVFIIYPNIACTPWELNSLKPSDYLGFFSYFIYRFLFFWGMIGFLINYNLRQIPTALFRKRLTHNFLFALTGYLFFASVSYTISSHGFHTVLHALLFMHIGRIHLHALYPAERKRAGNRTSSF